MRKHLASLATKPSSLDMLEMAKVMYTIFMRDGFNYFSDLIPTLHNYITIDTKAFLRNPDFMMAMFNMAKTMFEVKVSL